MIYTKEGLATNALLRDHWDGLWAIRNMFDSQQQSMIAANQAYMTPEQLQCNAIQGITQTAWAAIDNRVIQLRDQEIGMDILNDLMSVQTVLPVGKTASFYNMAGDIADDVAVSIDGQAPYSKDNTGYSNDGDPIPMFTAGFGVNWRHAAGLNSVGVDLILDSQTAKTRVFNRRLVEYALNGNARINVDGKPGEGLKNHRNTVKINLGTGAGGAAIDLTTASGEELVDFFTTGAYGQTATENRVAAYDITWVSPQIMANLRRVYVVNNVTTGTVLDQIMRNVPNREFRQTFALVGNEFLAYVRRSDYVSPLIGMPTQVTPEPRPLPISNYNFLVAAAMGIRVARDDAGLSGVVYGANLA